MPWINILTKSSNEIPSSCNAYDVLFLADGMLRLKEDQKQLADNTSPDDEHDHDLSAINMLITEIEKGISEWLEEEGDDREKMLPNRIMPNERDLPTSKHDDPQKIRHPQKIIDGETDKSTQSHLGFESCFENFPGNNRFYILLSMFRREYMNFFNQDDEAACDSIARKIVSIICDDCNPPGKFLEYDIFDICCHWKPIGRADAIKRVKMAFLNPPTVTLARAFPYHNIEQANTNRVDYMSEENTITTEFSSTAFNIKEDYPRRFSSYGSESMGSSHCLDSCYLSQNQSDSISNASSIDTSYVRAPSSFNLKRNRGRHKIDVDDKFRRRGVLATFWQEDENEYDMDEEEKTINLGNELFLVNSNLVKLVEKKFTELNDRSIRDDSTITDIGEDFRRFHIAMSDTGSLKNKRKRKYENKDTIKKVERMKTHEIKHTKVKTSLGGLRNLSELDILCQMGANYHPEPLNVNHIGNNRLKAIIQMYINRYRDSSCKTSRNHILFQIISKICVGTKGQVSFIHPQDNNIWAEYDMLIACKILMGFLESCILDPSLYQLPSVGTPVYIRKTPIITLTTLQQESLEIIRKRRKKGSKNIIRDANAVKSLQRSVRIG